MNFAGKPAPGEARELENADARADGRRRTVTLAPDRVTILRRVAGVAMRIALAPRRYAGVSLRIARLDEGGFVHEVRLTHADPDLSVLLAQSWSEAEARGHWRRWAHYLALPRLVERIEGAPEIAHAAPPAPLAPTTRRRGHPTLRRRPRFLRRRKTG